MKKSKLFRLLLAIATVTAFYACDKSSDSSNDEESSDPVDVDGVVTQAISAGISANQLIDASSSSNIAGSSVLIPVGSLSLDTNISIEEGGVLATSGALPTDLGVSGDTTVTSSGTPVAILSSEGSDLQLPMTISIPIPSASTLALAEDLYEYLIVLFRVTIDGKTYTGILPRSYFEIVSNFVVFEYEHFGVFQAVYTQSLFEDLVTIETVMEILTAKEEAAATPTPTPTPVPDTTPPAVPGVDTPSGTFEGDTTIYVQLTHAKSEPDFKELRYTLSASPASPTAPTNCQDGIAILPLIDITVGTGVYTLNAISCDKTGNASAPVTRTYTVTEPS